jgi:DNA-binding response OmpR family regulator
MASELFDDCFSDKFDRRVEDADIIVVHENGAETPLPNVCQRVRGRTDVPIRTLVDRYNEQTMCEAFEAGANDYIYPD